ncbi:MAG: hypothetical protein IH995_08995 [Proteobacteria bacterium]|nr:hypothetical protein [Pseudomonadota bacterium]
MARSLPLATVVITAAAVIGLQIIAGNGVVSQAQGSGDLLLDWAIDDNTPTSVGVIDTECQPFSAGTLVQIDIIAVNASDWSGIDFVIEYPAPAAVIAPGPNDGREGGAFDFVQFNAADPANTAGAENFLFPDSTDNNADYVITEPASDSNSPHGISMFDNTLETAGNSGDGALARISLDTTGMATGVHTLSLSTGTSADNNLTYAGGIHSDATPFQPHNFGAVQLAIDRDCPAGIPTPAPTPTAAATSGELLATGGASDTGDNDNGWLTALYIAGGLMAAMAAIGVISMLLRWGAANK